MLITNGSAMLGTVFDNINDLAMQLKIGDCLTFGSFVPCVDAFGVNIRFPMPWHVIDRKENKLKLLSYFFFDHIGYWSEHGKKEAVTWEDTSIRRDLNDKYFNDCFTEKEQQAILTTEVKTERYDSSFSVTNDKLYVPSLEDIENIPEHLKLGRTIAADCADKKTPAVDLFYCFYWLRDAGDCEDENLAVRGYSNSEIVIDSINHDADETGVRAVMWVDAEKIK